jgi:hypothetical protein
VRGKDAGILPPAAWAGQQNPGVAEGFAAAGAGFAYDSGQPDAFPEVPLDDAKVRERPVSNFIAVFRKTEQKRTFESPFE